jgi:hypothetical protein
VEFLYEKVRKRTSVEKRQTLETIRLLSEVPVIFRMKIVEIIREPWLHFTHPKKGQSQDNKQTENGEIRT